MLPISRRVRWFLMILKASTIWMRLGNAVVASVVVASVVVASVVFLASAFFVVLIASTVSGVLIASIVAVVPVVSSFLTKTVIAYRKELLHELLQELFSIGVDIRDKWQCIRLR
jgi:hypothetical protein